MAPVQALARCSWTCSNLFNFDLAAYYLFKSIGSKMINRHRIDAIGFGSHLMTKFPVVHNRHQNLDFSQKLILCYMMILTLEKINKTNWQCKTLIWIRPMSTLLCVYYHFVWGTQTQIYSSSLLSFSQAWSDTYGAFNQGVDENDVPHNWNPDAITLFGYTNRGVSGLVLSLKYSIGYLSVSDAKDMEIDYAFLENQKGNFVGANVSSVKLFIYSDPFNVAACTVSAMRHITKCHHTNSPEAVAGHLYGFLGEKVIQIQLGFFFRNFTVIRVSCRCPQSSAGDMLTFSAVAVTKAKLELPYWRKCRLSNCCTTIWRQTYLRKKVFFSRKMSTRV